MTAKNRLTDPYDDPTEVSMIIIVDRFAVLYSSGCVFDHLPLTSLPNCHLCEVYSDIVIPLITQKTHRRSRIFTYMWSTMAPCNAGLAVERSDCRHCRSDAVGTTFSGFLLFNTPFQHLCTCNTLRNRLPALATPCVLLTTSRSIPLSSSAL
jgi:hypothetical protein